MQPAILFSLIRLLHRHHNTLVTGHKRTKQRKKTKQISHKENQSRISVHPLTSTFCSSMSYNTLLCGKAGRLASKVCSKPGVCSPSLCLGLPAHSCLTKPAPAASCPSLNRKRERRRWKSKNTALYIYNQWMYLSVNVCTCGFSLDTYVLNDIINSICLVRM